MSVDPYFDCTHTQLTYLKQFAKYFTHRYVLAAEPKQEKYEHPEKKAGQGHPLALQNSNQLLSVFKGEDVA